MHQLGVQLMTTRVLARVLLLLSMGWVMSAGVWPMTPVRAGGTGLLCTWPDLDTWLPKADRVVVVRVDKVYPGGTWRPPRFRLTVEEVLVGESPRHMTIRTFGAQGMADDEPKCTGAPGIEVDAGDRLVLGFGPEPDRVDSGVSVAGVLDRRPRDPQPGLRRTTVAEARSILGLPATDAELPSTDVATTDSVSAARDIIKAAAEWLAGVLHRLAASPGEG
ncbi:MAG: hypothetical protein U0667_18080 [Chloroflexota bacterium]